MNDQYSLNGDARRTRGIAENILSRTWTQAGSYEEEEEGDY